MVKILSVGTATQDVFLSGEIFTPLCEEGVCYEHLKLGDKLYADNATFTTGGNAGNASVTFARAGLESKFVGVIGTDPSGKAVLEDLVSDNVDVSMLTSKDSFVTSYSVILLAPGGERTILRVKGSAPADSGHENFADNLDADWVYLSSLGSMELLEKVIASAAKSSTKIAMNPGTLELKNPDRLKAILPRLSVLALNKEEAQTLFEGETIQELAKNAAKIVEIAIVTDGPKGEAASDGKHVCTGGMYDEVPVKDRLGAGDAFASGFTAMIAQGKSMEEAITYASANSTSVVSFVGAKRGILKKDAKLHSMDFQCES